MKISEIGEFGLIKQVSRDCIVDPSQVYIGIGDDAAVTKPVSGMLQLTTTDMLVEGVHFTPETITPYQLGWKAMAVNVSDIAAMGGIPRHAVVAIGLRRETSVEWVKEFYRGMREMAVRHNVNIIGGDTVSSPEATVVSLTVLGEVEPAKLALRTGARHGDLLVVTGSLGNSAAGLEVILHPEIPLGADHVALLRAAHFTPQPRVAEARALVETGAVTSMNDISDGLANEINEIAAASGVGVRLWAEKIPVSTAARTLARQLAKSPLDFALYGGEDYELVFTVTRERGTEICELLPRLTGTKATIVGEIVPHAQGIYLVNGEGREEPLLPKGYNHFR